MYTWEQIAGVIRHILTAGGAILVALGFAEQTFIDTFVQQALGVIMLLGPMIWSWLRKTPASVVAQAADIVPIPATVQKSAGVAAPQTVPTNPQGK